MPLTICWRSSKDGRGMGWGRRQWAASGVRLWFGQRSSNADVWSSPVSNRLGNTVFVCVVTFDDGNQTKERNRLNPSGGFELRRSWTEGVQPLVLGRVENGWAKAEKRACFAMDAKPRWCQSLWGVPSWYPPVHWYQVPSSLPSPSLLPSN